MIALASSACLASSSSLARLLLAAALAGIAVPAAHARLEILNMRTEYRANPMGIDAREPRLSWELAARQRDQRQVAYEIRVADTEAQLPDAAACRWATGRVPSDRTSHIVYAGRPLQSRQRCWWSVRVWDQDGRVTAWSRPAFWEMGLLEPGAWEAEWIGLEQAWAGESTWSNACWIWAAPNAPMDAQPTPPLTNPIPVVALRRWVELPVDREMTRAHLRLTADDYFELFVNGAFVAHSAGKPYSSKFLQEYELDARLRPGRNLIAVMATNRQEHAGVLGQLSVEFDRGQPLTVETDPSWRVHPAWAAEFSQTHFADASWAPATAVARLGAAPFPAFGGGPPAEPAPPMQPCPMLRKTFNLEGKLKQARLYATARGVYEFFINGERVSADVFNPGWTDYRRRIQYHAYDVTPLLRRQENVLGLLLGDGWYAGFAGLAGRAQYGRRPWALAQLELEYTDGSRQVIATDASWKATTGPLRRSDMLMGELYDARLERPGWQRPGFDDDGWQPATVDSEPPALNLLVAAPDAPVRQTQQLAPLSVTEPVPGRFVFDLGQNLVGRVRLKVRGSAGDEVTLRFAEMINPDGTLYTENLREARCTDHYILRGGGTEVYEPHFTFHGFRYVELAGYPGRPDRMALTGIVLHSDTPPAGTFECSNPLVNQLHSNIVWGQRGNFLSIPTDCPQRDERLGWTGDAQVFIRTATYNMDVAAFFTKWCQDVEDAQRPDGAFTDVVPFVAASQGTAAWGDAGVICPWTLYRVYGDRRILERHYDAAERWIAYLQQNSTNHLRPATRYGDWLSINADTPLDLLATAYYAHSTRLVAEMAAVLGKTRDARRYRELFQHIRAAFHDAYVSPDGRIHGDTQTGYLMALQFDLLPPEKRPLAVAHLVADIRAKADHLSTGFVGVGLLMPALTEAGQVAVAYRLLNQETFPSWLYSVKNGATTLWERWDGWTREHGFQTPWMNSFNHYSLGSVGQWLFETVGGIGLDPETPGFKRIIIRPQPGGGLAWAKANYHSMHGPIASHWSIRDGVMTLQVEIPANTRATVFLPCDRIEHVREARRPVTLGNGIRYLWRGAEYVACEIGSGRYEFSAPIK